MRNSLSLGGRDGDLDADALEVDEFGAVDVQLEAPPVLAGRVLAHDRLLRTSASEVRV